MSQLEKLRSQLGRGQVTTESAQVATGKAQVTTGRAQVATSGQYSVAQEI